MAAAAPNIEFRGKSRGAGRDELNFTNESPNSPDTECGRKSDAIRTRVSANAA